MMKMLLAFIFVFFFFNGAAPTDIYTLSLHDALPISPSAVRSRHARAGSGRGTRPFWRSSGRWTARMVSRSEEHTSELQSRGHLVCRLLLEKKNQTEDHYQRVLL